MAAFCFQIRPILRGSWNKTLDHYYVLGSATHGRSLSKGWSRRERAIALQYSNSCKDLLRMVISKLHTQRNVFLRTKFGVLSKRFYQSGLIPSRPANYLSYTRIISIIIPFGILGGILAGASSRILERVSEILDAADEDENWINWDFHLWGISWKVLLSIWYIASLGIVFTLQRRMFCGVKKMF